MEGYLRGEDVLNGIAYDAAGDRLWVTGKLWPRLFRVALVGPPVPSAPSTSPPPPPTSHAAPDQTTIAAASSPPPPPARVVAAMDGGPRRGGGGVWVGAATGVWAAVLRQDPDPWGFAVPAGE